MCVIILQHIIRKQLLRENELIYKEFPISSSQSEAIKIDLAIKSILDKLAFTCLGYIV